MANELSVPTAERTLRLIELLLSRSEGWTPQELLLQLDLSRSSLFLILRTLKALGYVEQAGKRGRYSPGPRLQAWRAPHSPSSQDLLTAFYQEVNHQPPAARPQQETLALALPAVSGSSSIFIVAQVEGSAQVRSAFTTGKVYKHLQAAARVLTLPADADTQAQGYNLSVDEETINLALPVCRDGIHPEAALLLSAPAFRWRADQLRAAYLDELRDRAAHLSYRIGAPFYAPYQGASRPALPGTTPMEANEMSQFLRGPWAASLACIRPDGKPHVIPVWQEWDGEAFFVIAWQGSQWGDYLLTSPDVSLTIDEPWPPLRRVVVQGCAEVIQLGQEGAVDLTRLIERMTQRYLGQPVSLELRGKVQRAFRIQPRTLRGWRGLIGGIEHKQEQHEYR